MEQSLIALRDHPERASTLYSRRKRGLLWSPLPGLFTSLEDSLDLRVQSALLWAPDLTLCGTAAAYVSWWPEAPVHTIWLAGARKESPASWLRVTRDRVHPDWIDWQEDNKIAAPALSALQAAMELGGEAIDAALRLGIPLKDLWAAFNAMPKQKGKAALRQLLRDSRDEPWSELERKAHRLLREAGIKGWKSNYKLVTRGRAMYIDIAFPGKKIAIELDGYAYHSSKSAFKDDRERQNALVLDGWTVLRFTHETVDDLPNMVREILRTK